MTLSHKAKRRWALFLLLVWLPVFIVLAMMLMTMHGRMPLWVEVIAYPLLGILWALPFKRVFRGVGTADPEDEITKSDK